MTPWTVARQDPLSMRFPRQEYWSGLPFPSPGVSSWPRDRTQVSCIAGRFFTAEPPGKPYRSPAGPNKELSVLCLYSLFCPILFLKCLFLMRFPNKRHGTEQSVWVEKDKSNGKHFQSLWESTYRSKENPVLWLFLLLLNHTYGPSGILPLFLLICFSADVILSSAGHSDLCIGKGKIIW